MIISVVFLGINEKKFHHSNQREKVTLWFLLRGEGKGSDKLTEICHQNPFVFNRFKNFRSKIYLVF